MREAHEFSRGRSHNTFPALEADSTAFAADVARRSIPVALDEHGFPQESTVDSTES
ncbi:MAG: hypothetical protein J07HQX50_01370 [Haloquadratum sp. J07HQX50]|nr:MAG: hypothetical protein J07HQX50_01370 [Haloquadratum sp. J07HQX50]